MMNPLTYRLSTAAMLALSLAGCGGRISDSLEIQQRDESATFRATGDPLVVEEPELFLREGVLLKQTESVVSAIAEVNAGSPKVNGSSLEGEGERANAPGLVGCAAGSWLTQSNQCEPCFPGTWDHDEDVLTACENHSACAARQRVLLEGSSVSDRTCEEIPPWEFFTEERVRAISQDTQGALIFIGNRSVEGKSQAFVGKLDAFGKLIWTRSMSPADSEELSGKQTSYAGLTLDSRGTIFCVGLIDSIQGPGSSHVLVTKYSPDGGLLGFTSIDSSTEESLEDVVLDSLGNLHAVGASYSTEDLDNDVLLLKFSPELELMSSSQFGSASYDNATAIAIDNLGVRTVAGITYGKIGAKQIGQGDIYVARIAADGTLGTTKQFGTERVDRLSDLACDALGHCHVAGNTWGSFSGSIQDSYGLRGGRGDALVAKLDSGLEIEWRYQRGSFGGDSFEGISLTPRGVLAVGFALKASSGCCSVFSNATAVELGENGTELGSVTLPAGLTQFTDILIGPSGSFYSLGRFMNSDLTDQSTNYHVMQKKSSPLDTWAENSIELSSTFTFPE